MKEKKFNKITIGCLPLFIILLFPLLMILMMSSGKSKNVCGNLGINSGGHIFTEDYVVTQGFGFTNFATDNPLYAGTGVGHTGIDLQPVNFRDFGAEDVGVHSISDGIVLEAGYNDISGNFVTVRASEELVFYYGHLKNHEVKKGQEIKIGDKLGNMGQTGAATGYHVHFEAQTNYPNLATEDSSKYLGKEKLNSGDIISVSDKIDIEDNKNNTKGKS